MKKRLRNVVILCLIVATLVLTTSCNEPQNEGTTPEDSTTLPAVADTPVSEGLAFAVNEDGKTCTITGIGTCTDTKIYIPERIEGYSVTCIGQQAFADNTSLTFVSIPDSVTSIYSTAFKGCTALLETENGISYVDKWVVKGDHSITTASLRENTVGIAEGSFAFCVGLKDVILPDSIKYIDAMAFYSCHSLTNVVLPQHIECITDTSFSKCKNLQSIQFSAAVISIEGYAFEYCSALTEIRFLGTVAQWNAIEKGINWNSQTGEYTVHCSDGDVTKQ